MIQYVNILDRIILHLKNYKVVKESMKKKLSVEKMYCRSFQTVMKIGMNLLPWHMPKTIQGPGSVKKLPMLIQKKGYKKPLIVTGKVLTKLCAMEGMTQVMEHMGMEYVLFNHVDPNPTDLNVEEGARVYRENHCDCIVAFGGGSPMDCAKGIGARIARPHKKIRKMQGLFGVLRPIPMLFAVPTTAGTGSETTIAAVITEASSHHKASMNDLCLMPKYAVLDPELTVGLPPQMTATSGMDALCHAVEAYTNERYNSKLEKELCLKAVKLIYDHLYPLYLDGSDLSGRQAMQKAAFYAGRAFTRGCVGYVHAIGHTLGGLYGTPHGLAMAILLPHVMRAYGFEADERLAELCDACGIKATNDSNTAKAEAFIRWIEDMKEKMDIPKYPPILKTEDIDQIVEWAYKEANPLYPTPVTWSRADFKRFILSLKEES